MKTNIAKPKKGSATKPSLVPATLKEQQRRILKLEKQVSLLKLELAQTSERDLLSHHLAKEKRATELNLANKELLFQNNEKEKIAAALNIANIELLYQNGEKENRAAELGVANIELIYQNSEKEKRAAELGIANIELLFQNGEKEKRAAELGIANIELKFQNREKEKRAAELAIANIELLFQNAEKEKRAAELSIANKELLAFNYISSHDLQEPLRKIQTFADSILKTEYANLSEQGKDYFNRMHNAARRMQALIKDLLDYAHTDIQDRKFETTDLNEIVQEACDELTDNITGKNAVIHAGNLGKAYINKFQFQQLINNLLSNALKFSKPGVPCEIVIKYNTGPGLQFENENPGLMPGKLSATKLYCHLNLADNGIGYDSKYNEQIFEVFKRLHAKEEYVGTGIGLAIVKKIIDNHRGAITSNSELGKGASFDIYIPENEVAA